MSAKQEKIEEIRAAARKKAAAYLRLFSTPDGKIVLADLQQTFEDPPLYIAGDPHGTHGRIGEHEVIRHIKRVMIEAAKHGELER